MFCGKCGKKLPDEAKFCTECGHKLPERKLKVETVAPPVVQPVQEQPAYIPEENWHAPEAPVEQPIYEPAESWVTPETTAEQPIYEPAEDWHTPETPVEQPIYQPENDWYTPEPASVVKPEKAKKQKQQKPKKKGKAGVVIAIILILALAAGAVWFFLFGGKDVIGGLLGKNQIEVSDEVLEEIIALEGLDDFDDPFEITYAKVTETEEYEFLGVDCKDEYITVKAENEYVILEAGYIVSYSDDDGEWLLENVDRNDEYCEYGHGFISPIENISKETVKELVTEFWQYEEMTYGDISISEHEIYKGSEVELTVTFNNVGHYFTADVEGVFMVTPDGWHIDSLYMSEPVETDKPQASEKPESDEPIPIETEKQGEETEADETETLESEAPEIEIPATPEEIIDAAYALKSGESLPYTCTLIGVIVRVDTKYNENYDNITVTIAVEGKEDKPIMCYRLEGAGADYIGVGDTITVTGTLNNYKGTVEFAVGCTLDAFTLSEPAETEAPQTTPPETEAPQTKPVETEPPQTIPPETEAPVVSDPKASLRVPAGYEVAVFTHDSATDKTIIIAKKTSDKLYYILDTNGNLLIETGYDSYSNIGAPYFGLKGKIYKYNFSKNIMENVVREVYERLMSNTSSDVYYNKEMDLLVTVDEDWSDEWDKYTVLDSRYNKQYYEMQLSLFDTYPRAGSYEQRKALQDNGNPYDMIGHTPIVVKKCSFSVSRMRLTDTLGVQVVINDFSTTNKYGVFGTSIPYEYDELYAYAPEWSPLWYVANVGSDWGVIDNSNKQIIKFKYGDIMVFANFEDGGFKLYAAVSKMVNGKKAWGVVDEDGNTIVPFEYEQIVPINFTTELKQFGFLGMAGPNYSNENLEFYVKKNGNWSAISAR